MSSKNKNTSFLEQTYSNIISGWTSIAVVAIASIILTPLLLNNLGKEIYGLWLLIFNFLGYLYLADFGITNAITRLYAKYNVDENKDLSKLISTSYFIVILIDLILILILVISKDSIFGFLNIKDEFLEIFTFLFLVGIIEIFSQFILRVNIGILKGKHKFDYAYRLEGLAAFLRLIVISSLLITNTFNIFTFAILYSLIKIFSDGLSLIYIWRDLKQFRFEIDFKTLRELFDIGSSTLLSSLSGLLMNSFPILLFGKFFGLGSVFLYSIPIAVSRILTRLINTFYNGVNPKSSELKAVNNLKEIKEISSFGVKFSILLSFSFLLFVIIFGEKVLSFWLGNSVVSDEDLIILSNMLSILLFFVFLETSQKINIFIYKSTGLHWFVTLESVMSTSLLYLLSYLLYDYLGLYIFAISLVMVGFFKFIFYKFVARNKIPTYSMSFFSFLVFCIFCAAGLYFKQISQSSLTLGVLLFFFTYLIFFLVHFYYLFSFSEKQTIIRQAKVLFKK